MRTAIPTLYFVVGVACATVLVLLVVEWAITLLHRRRDDARHRLAALLPYVRHAQGCARSPAAGRDVLHGLITPCSCGLDAVLFGYGREGAP